MVRPAIVAVLLVAAVLAGAAVGWQLGPRPANDCVGGAQLHLQAPADPTPNRSFAALSPRFQRVFLEAVTDDANLSRYYDSTTLAPLSDVVITYRDTAYHAGIVHTDCPV